MTIEAKICGITTAEAMDTAIAEGAALVGLVFYERSPRHLAYADAARLAQRAAGRAIRTALVVDPEDADLKRLTEAVPVDLLQLHGSETPRRTAEIRARFGLPVMKVLKVAEAGDLKAATAYYEVADRLLFDAKPPKSMKGALPGGNALAFDWNLLAGRRFPRPWLLAGGLTPDNVAAAIRATGARGVDVSSGVESKPGLKDPEKIRRFLRATRGL